MPMQDVEVDAGETVENGDGGGVAAQGEITSDRAEECEPRVVEGDTPKIARDPGMPTAAQREAHDLTHFPFRRWCEHCVRGQATGDQHRSVSGEMGASEVPRLHMDYGFLKEDVTRRRMHTGKRSPPDSA